MGIFDKAWDLVSGTPDWARKWWSQISASEAVKELRELRGEQEQLNMALAVRLLDLQKSTAHARAEASEGLNIARRIEGQWRDKLRQLEASEQQLAEVRSGAERLLRQADTADARRNGVTEVLGQRIGKLERLLWAALIGIVILVAAIAWLAAKELA